MFSDPMSVSDDGTVKALPRVGNPANGSDYRLEDAGVIHTLRLSHDFGGSQSGKSSKSNQRRAVMRYERESLIENTLLDQTQRALITATLTLNWPTIVAASDAAKRGVTIALLATAANLLRLVNGET